MIEKLKQQLVETKEKAKEEKEKLEQKYTIQINELEGQFYQKAKEIGMIQTELKTIKQFQKRKIQVEKELDERRLEQEAEKRLVMLAERAHHEAVVKSMSYWLRKRLCNLLSRNHKSKLFRRRW